MKTKEIIKDLIDNDWFNFNKWSTKECAEYIKANYNCSDYVAKNVAVTIQGWNAPSKSNFELGF